MVEATAESTSGVQSSRPGAERGLEEEMTAATTWLWRSGPTEELAVLAASPERRLRL